MKLRPPPVLVSLGRGKGPWHIKAGSLDPSCPAGRMLTCLLGVSDDHRPYMPSGADAQLGQASAMRACHFWFCAVATMRFLSLGRLIWLGAEEREAHVT